MIATWTAGQLSPVQPYAARVAVAVDGEETVRGARLAGDGPAPHLLSAATHDRSLGLAHARSEQDQIPTVVVIPDDRGPGRRRRTAGHDPAATVFTVDPCTPSTPPPTCSSRLAPATS